jgi:regulator of sirC expression with transglutaminase-like and TPR domain
MSLQNLLPQTISKYKAALVLGLSPYQVMALVTTKKIQSISYEEISVAGIAKYLSDERGYEQDYIEYFLFERLCQNS